MVACGSDDEGPRARSAPATTSADPPTPDGAGAAPALTTANPEATTEDDQAEPVPSEEERVEGGPGDEIPAEVPALLDVRGDRLWPASVRVPPYISVLVEVRVTAEPREIRIGRRTRRAEGDTPASFRLAGLRPQETVTVRLAGGGSARIVASAEPGP